MHLRPAGGEQFRLPGGGVRAAGDDDALPIRSDARVLGATLRAGASTQYRFADATRRGYLVSASFHLMLGIVPFSREIIVVLSGISFFFVWGGLMIVAFLARKGWKIWCLYLALTLAFGAITWFLK